MLDKLLISFKDNIRRNTRNPFLGSLILIWVIRNWKILFALFADNRSFEKRLKFIEEQLKASTFLEIMREFGINVGLAILSVFVIYSLIYLTRYITNRFENQLLPKIYEWSAPDKVVLKSELEKVEIEKESLEQKLKVEKDKRIEAQAEVDKLEKEKGERLVESLTTPKTNYDINSDIESNEDYIDQIKSDAQDLMDRFEIKKIQLVFDAALNGYEFKSNDENTPLIRYLVRKGYMEFFDKAVKRGTTYRTYNVTDKGKTLTESFL